VDWSGCCCGSAACAAAPGLVDDGAGTARARFARSVSWILGAEGAGMAFGAEFGWADGGTMRRDILYETRLRCVG